MRRRIALALLATVAVAGGILALWPKPKLDVTRLPSARHYEVRILRDTWGVPHVFGKTDPDVAYGLAWAHAEDDFATIQGALLAARGRLATVLGKKGAPNDYMVQLLRVWDVVDAGYEGDLSPETRALCEAYADGLNAYAARHPNQAMAPLYPATGRDVVAGFVHKTPLFFGLDKTLTALLADEPRPAASMTPGSNTFAVAPRRSADGFTRLAINSHQPWEGPVAWYGAHLHSEAGWDMVGGLFPGAPIVLHGHNRDLGWAHTANRPDLIDVYTLEINPENADQYRFDGVWRTLEKRDAPIEVRIFGPLRWTFHREALWSVHGPVIRGPRGAFAIRFAGWGDVRAVEQWYRMNRAASLDEWMSALRMAALPLFNVGYADAKGHIAYVYNARLPDPIRWLRLVEGGSGQHVEDPVVGLPSRRSLAPGRRSGVGLHPELQQFALSDDAGHGEPAPRGLRAVVRHRDADDQPRAARTRAARRRRLDQRRGVRPLQVRCRVLERIGPGRERAADPGRTAAHRPPRPPSGRGAEGLGSFHQPREHPCGTGGARAAAERRQLGACGHRGPPRTAHHRGAEAREPLRPARGALERGHTPSARTDGSRPRRRARRPSRHVSALMGRSPAGRRRGRLVHPVVEWDREGVSTRGASSPTAARRPNAGSRHYADQAPLFAAGRLKPVWMDESEIRGHLEREYRPPDSARPDP